jgi:hypothetical protein
MIEPTAACARLSACRELARCLRSHDDIKKAKRRPVMPPSAGARRYWGWRRLEPVGNWISVSSSLLGGYDEPEILPSSSR